MKRCIATVSLYGELPEKLKAIADAGFNAIELFAGDMPETRQAARETAARIADLGLTVDLYQPLRDFEGVAAAQLPANLARAEHVFDLMAEVGTTTLLVCSNTGNVQNDDERAAAQLAQLADRAAARGLRIGYEALAWGTQVSTWQHAWKIVETVAHPALGIILDSFHVQVRPEDYSGIAKLPGDKITFVQLGDAPRMKLDPMTLRRQHSTLPGRGDMDVPSFVKLIKQTGYKGPLSIELFNLVDRTPALQMAKDAMDALEALDI